MSLRSALVTAAGGIGDIIRMTPLVRALRGLGYEVDLLLAPDYPGTVKLFDGAPEIRRLYYVPSAWAQETERRIDGLSERRYDVATFTVWSVKWRNLVSAQNTYSFDRRQWMQEGDIACSQRIAASLGWTQPLPPPFVVLPLRDFALRPGTVALHPGCKPGWPWKKWHGFEDVARALPDVVIVGTESDLESSGTYFSRRFEWPEHASDYVGKLHLADTAALIAQCAALISNDSGLMHIGVASGIPTVGVFGLTSPKREMIPAPNMVALTKGLACEPACRRQPWGRRDCDFHLECLKTLTADDVLRTLSKVLGDHRRAASIVGDCAELNPPIKPEVTLHG